MLAGRADLCALARPHLYDPHWTLHAAAEQEYDGVQWVAQYRGGIAQTAERARDVAERKELRRTFEREAPPTFAQPGTLTARQPRPKQRA